MSTQINVTVGSGGLSDKAKQLQAAARQAQLEKERTAQIEADGTEQRNARLAAEGKAPDGSSLYGVASQLPVIERRPAANRQQEAFVRFLPPTSVLPESPLDPYDQPEFQELVTRWWAVQKRGIPSPLGMAETVPNESYLRPIEEQSVNDMVTLFELTEDNFLTLDPSPLANGTQDDFTNIRLLNGFAETPLLVPSYSSISEIGLSCKIRVPPLGSEFFTNGVRSWSEARVSVFIRGSDPYFNLGFQVTVRGEVLPNLFGLVFEPSSLVSFELGVRPEGPSFWKINGETYPGPTIPIWSPNQTFQIQCRISGSLNRGSQVAMGNVPVPFPSVPEGLGAFGNVKATFKR